MTLDDAIRQRLLPSFAEICRRVGLHLTELSLRGVDLAAALRTARWHCDPEGRWRLGDSSLAGLPLADALGAQWVLAASAAGWGERLLRFGDRPSAGAGARYLSAAPLLGKEADAAVGPISGEDLALLAGALHRAMELSRGDRWYGPAAVRNRQSFDALARVGLPRPAPRQAARLSPPTASYLRAHGTAAE